MAAPIVAALTAVAGRVATGLGEGEAAMQDAEAHGVRLAGVEYSAGRRVDILQQAMSTTDDNVARETLNIQHANLVAEADAINAAAAAGVEGQSVDTTISDTERNKATALDALENIKQQQMLQLESDIVDTVMNAETQKGAVKFAATSSAAEALSTISAGVNTYMSSR